MSQTRQELEQRYSDLRAQADAPGADRHSHDLGMQMVNVLSELAALKHEVVEPVAPPAPPSRAETLAEASRLAEQYDNPFLREAIKAERNAGNPTHDMTDTGPTEIGDDSAEQAAAARRARDEAVEAGARMYLDEAVDHASNQ